MSGWLSRLFDPTVLPQDYSAPANQLGPLAQQVMRNPVGTETTSPYASQSVGVPSGPFNPIEAMTPSGQPILGTDMDRARAAVAQGMQEAPAMVLGMVGDAPGGKGFTAYHGSPADFERFDARFLHPDEAGHYFAQDERLAQDYAGRSKADPTAGHMYEVNIKADPASFLDYGSLSAKDQAALNDPGAMEKLRAAGVPGITLPDRTHVVFNDATIEILRKYGIAGLMAGGAGAAATQQPQQ